MMESYMYSDCSNKNGEVYKAIMSDKKVLNEIENVKFFYPNYHILFFLDKEDGTINVEKEDYLLLMSYEEDYKEISFQYGKDSYSVLIIFYHG